MGVGAEDGDSVAPAPGWNPPQAARRAPASDHNTPPMAATEAIDVEKAIIIETKALTHTTCRLPASQRTGWQLTTTTIWL